MDENEDRSTKQALKYKPKENIYWEEQNRPGRAYYDCIGTDYKVRHLEKYGQKFVK
jgi:hypothetical protein